MSRRAHFEALQNRKGSSPPELKMPPVDEGRYLINLLHEAGTVTRHFEGVGCLTWTEVKSWLEVTRNELTPWEVDVVMNLSHTYASMANKATDKNCPPPYNPILDDEEELAKQRQMVNDFFHRFAALHSERKKGRTKRGKKND